MNKFFVLGVLILISSGLCASSLPDFPFVVVHGNAEMDVAPDKAILSLNVMDFNKNSEESVSNVFKRGNEIVQLALKNGVLKDDIKSSMYNKETKRASSSDGRNDDLAINGYEVEQSFTITINNLEMYTNLVDSIASLQNVSNLRVEFYVKNEAVLLEKLRIEASKDANKKSNSLAEGLGQKIAGVFAATESADFGSDFSASFGISYEHPPYPAFSITTENGGKNMFIPKSITLRSSVTVIYKIKPNT